MSLRRTKDIWPIQTTLQVEERANELAMFNLKIDSKLFGCHVANLKVEDVAPMRRGGFRNDLSGCLLLGLQHGAYGIGCWWVLMALLFVSGILNVLWIALLAVLVLFEKLTAFETLDRALCWLRSCRSGHLDIVSWHSTLEFENDEDVPGSRLKYLPVLTRIVKLPICAMVI